MYPLEHVRASFGTWVCKGLIKGCDVFEQDLAFISQEEISLPWVTDEEVLVLAQIQPSVCSTLQDSERGRGGGRTDGLVSFFFFTIRVWAIPCGVETMPVAEKVKYSHTNWQPKGAGYDSWGELAVVVVLYVCTRGGIGLLSSGNFIHMWYPSSTQPLSHTHCGMSAWKSAIKIQWIIVTLSLSRSSLLLFFCWFCQAVYLNKTNKWN